ncbi:50S ribosomal protein L22 [Candidatus Woesearchaeota archaeon CG10_big_fil_rev_8_21_14_0_10_44_13]|nr:MAG: 50S ribosomal protein L22 [Candidatus Woesearchaeota archaeon CG10_big_fil_rev_8_21_14_0_10_44_13]
MSAHNYAFQGYDKEKMAKVVGRDLPISTKQSIEICNFIKGRKLEKAKEIMEAVIKMKTPVPFKRFTEGAGHKRGKIAGGRYPIKASGEILGLLNSIEANAQQKGLNTSALIIKHACANKASRPPRYGRMRGLQAKRTHIELVAVESEQSERPEKSSNKSLAKSKSNIPEQKKTDEKATTDKHEKSERPEQESKVKK